MKVHISDIPQEIIDEYNVMLYANEDGFVYVEIMGAIYGLKQAGKISNDDLIEYLKEFGYYPSIKHQGCGYTKPERSASPWLWII